MKPSIHILASATLIFILLAAPSNAWDGERSTISQMAGELVINSGQSAFITPGAQVTLGIDPALVARGDRLDIYIVKKSLPGHRQTQRLEQAGKLLVTSLSTNPTTAGVISVSKEIRGHAFAGFTLRPDEQLNRYLPFIQTMADNFIDGTIPTPVNVAMIDVLNPYGDITANSRVIKADMAQHVCARPQFHCVSGSAVSKVLMKNGLAVSRGMKSFDTSKLLDEASADVAVTGRYRKMANGGTQLLLLASSTHSGHRPGRVWRVFNFKADEPGMDSNAGEKVIVSYAGTRRGRLKIRRADISSVEGMKARYLFHEDIVNLFGWKAMQRARVEPENFFVTIDGAPQPDQGAPALFDGEVKTGRRTVTLGYYPALISPAGERKISGAPVAGTINLDVKPGADIELVMAGTIEKGYAIIAVDIDRKKN